MALKGIIAVKAMSQLSSALGKSADSSSYSVRGLSCQAPPSIKIAPARLPIFSPHHLILTIIRNYSRCLRIDFRVKPFLTMGSSIFDVGRIDDGRLRRYGILGSGLQPVLRQVVGNKLHQFIGMSALDIMARKPELACEVLNCFG